ncbi:hypothetical protein Ga0102493_111891 [Erythrobacter litoralis]|uniref:Uncharacterized protein n=1 Tax=Erythrobacter litoralis TaxID=39960 RepID=A0A074MJ10_9SPHN|nr:hypothetical protein [Erythrobacter litoralis]AOL22912.1 hypothetical protein Ga0102493_111891 [Erythrobacter litoralis]KEO92790.1 hypothetical protein EH32_13425 [Erythrobacter litoralis]MEE4337799.1 hypothetical protein [Erythrobacter sp.]
MMDPVIVIAASCLVGLAVVAFALLRAWHEWLDYKRQELERSRNAARLSIDTPEDQRGAVGAARIELADLRERIRKLEAIASGVEL